METILSFLNAKKILMHHHTSPMSQSMVTWLGYYVNHPKKIYAEKFEISRKKIK